VKVTAEQPMPTSETEIPFPDLPKDLRQQLDRFLLTGVKWDDDTVVDIFGPHPSSDKGRTLTAEITAQYEKALVIRLVVERHDGAPMGDTVIFLLHPTFRARVRVVPVEGDDRADLEIYCTAWFTVGAIADDGQTMLAFDLRNVPGAPEWFKRG
jgi:hypothetical protein